MAAWVADFPWDARFKPKVSKAIKELMRVAPIGYTLSPFTYGASWLKEPTFMVPWMPGVNQALVWVRYERKELPPP